MKVPLELLAHRSSKNTQMSDETSSSSSDDSSDVDSNSEEESCTAESSEEEGQDVTPAVSNYLHQPWLLANAENDANLEVTQNISLSQKGASNEPESSDQGSSSGTSSDSEESGSDGGMLISVNQSNDKQQMGNKASKKNLMPEWESNPEIYGLRRSSRQRKEPTRLNLKEDSEDSSHHHKKKKRPKDYDAPGNLTDSSEEDSSESEYSSSWKKNYKRTGRSFKANQLRAKVQGRAAKKSKGSKYTGWKSSANRHRKCTESTLSEDNYSSEDNQPTRSSQRIQRSNKISYKENDSTQETESDEIVEAVETWNEVEDDGAESIEKILDTRVGRLGATGSKTTVYTCKKEGDPNKGFDQEEEGETQYLIKWKGRSHSHNTWESEATLLAQKCRGMKRFENYVKRQEEVNLYLNAASPEDREYYYCQVEMNRNVLANYSKVDRIIARSANKNDKNCWEYEVKWHGLPYSECTWEDEELILKDFKNEIDAFEMRQDNPCVPKRDCKVLRQRPRFVPMTRQPDWLKSLKLRDYQLMGVNWLAHSWCKGNSVILADEMGLGKTIQSITFLSYLYHTHELYGLFLVIVPLSTMPSWQQEFQTWAPYMNVIVYMGDQRSRAKIREVEWTFPNKCYKFNAVLTSYEILLKDKTFLGSHAWSVIAVDEAHRLKNDDSLLYRSLKEFQSNHRLLITGTPLQNSLKELWALLHFIMPQKFESWAEFEEDHAQNRDSGYASLHKVLQPYLLRRVKKDVEKSLPSKVEQILRVPMASLQKQYYKWLLTKNYTALCRGSRGSFSSFCNIIMELKKCCNHAYLVKAPEHEPSDRDVALQNLLRNSGKMVLLDKLLRRLKENGHRVLIFSQMVRMLDILQEYLIARRLQFQRLDGSVNSDNRRRALDHFNAEGSEDFCFLLSTRAGGLGINLATADTVIIFDSDWNPMNDLQAQARAHRIGQKNQVNIYRLVCAGSVEEDIIERAKKKMVLDHLVIQRMDTSGKTVLFKNTAPSSTTNNPFNKDELAVILQFGAVELFQEAEGDEKEPECDIDEILRRAETRQDHVESNVGDSLLSAFKVATFNLDEEEQTEMGKDWDDIIPEKDRIRIAEEDRQKKEAELYLPRRARKKMKMNEGSESDNSDSNSSEDEEDAGDAVNALPRRRGRPPRGGARDDTDYIKGFTTAEVRRFIRSFRKFGDPLNRLEAIARDAELSEQSEADLQRLGQKLHNKLHEMAKLTSENQEPREEGTKQGRGRGPSFRLAGVSVSVKTTLACIEDLQPLVDFIPKDPGERKSFRLNISVRPMWAWDCSWGLEDDSHLLVGIYEYGMGSWEQLQSDPSLKLDKKILRPNGEKPQAKQLQSRSEHLIKLLRKTQDQNHLGVSGVGASHNRRKGVSNRDARSSAAQSMEAKPKRKNRKIKSKSRVDVVDSDIETPDIASTCITQVKEENLLKTDDGNVNTAVTTNDARYPEKTKRGRRKRKVTYEESGTSTLKQNPVTVSESITAPKEKRRKTNNKDVLLPSKPIQSRTKIKGPIHITHINDPVPVGNDEVSSELDPETFRECKERLRPVKRALKQLDRPPSAAESCEQQVKEDHTRRCLLQIGDRVIECLREFHDPEVIKTQRRNLWIFVSKFTEFDPEKLHKLYRLATKKRQHEKRDDNEKSHKSHHVGGDSKKLCTNEETKVYRNSASGNQSRKIQHKADMNKKRPSPVNEGEGNKNDSPTKDKSKRGDAIGHYSAVGEKIPSGSRSRNFSPYRHIEETHNRFSVHKPPEERGPWARRPTNRLSPDYLVRDNFVQHRRSPFNEPRHPPPSNSPPDARLYNREHDYRDGDRPMCDYPRSPPRHRPHPPDRYWRGAPDYRGSPPPHDYHGLPPAVEREWESRHHHTYSPPRSSYSYHRARQRSPPGRSPHSDYRIQRRRRPGHYPNPDNRGQRSARYGQYGDSPMTLSPIGYSSPSAENGLPDNIRRAEKT